GHSGEQHRSNHPPQDWQLAYLISCAALERMLRIFFNKKGWWLCLPGLPTAISAVNITYKTDMHSKSVTPAAWAGHQITPSVWDQSQAAGRLFCISRSPSGAF